MAPGFQSSFIPKDPITPEIFKKKKAGVFGILGLSLFIFSIVLAVAVVIYKNIVKDDIANLQAELAQAEKNIDKESIKKMLQFNRKLAIAKSIVQKHHVVSGFLTSLASSTVSTVSFSEFGYSNLTANGLSVTLKGKTNSYASVALQESIFLKNQYWKSVTFSNLSLGEKGMVSFDVNVVVDPQIVIYNPPVTTLPASASTNDDLEDTTLDDLGSIDIDGIGSEINNL